MFRLGHGVGGNGYALIFFPSRFGLDQPRSTLSLGAFPDTFPPSHIYIVELFPFGGSSRVGDIIRGVVLFFSVNRDFSLCPTLLSAFVSRPPL